MISFPKPADPANSYGGTYDAWNRLVAVSDGQNTVATYAFDGMGRRIVKSPGGLNPYDYYYTTNHQLLEENHKRGRDSFLELRICFDPSCSRHFDPFVFQT